jgi:hypothetical protein
MVPQIFLSNVPMGTNTTELSAKITQKTGEPVKDVHVSNRPTGSGKNNNTYAFIMFGGRYGYEFGLHTGSTVL